MEQFDGIMKLAGTELDSIIKNGKFRSREEIDSVGKLIDMVKDIHCIWQYEDEENSYAYDNGPYVRGERNDGRNRISYRGNGYNDDSYGDGSYARGRRGNVRRDSMGRYSRDGGKDEYIENLRNMMQDAPDEQTRQSIQRMIQQMEHD